MAKMPETTIRFVRDADTVLDLARDIFVGLCAVPVPEGSVSVEMCSRAAFDAAEAFMRVAAEREACEHPAILERDAAIRERDAAIREVQRVCGPSIMGHS